MTDSTITTDRHEADRAAGLLLQIRDWGRELGFQALGFTGIELAEHRDYLDKWLAAGYHGEMGWMSSHGKSEVTPNHWSRAPVQSSLHGWITYRRAPTHSQYWPTVRKLTYHATRWGATITSSCAADLPS